jgi:GlpG protein
MRQLGTLPSESDAHRLAAWLVTQRIDAHAEPDGDGWAIWVRDEDHLQEARTAFEDFRTNPQDERYRGVESTAERIRREEERDRQKARGNIVEMRGQWGTGFRGAARRCPLALACIGLSILATLAAGTYQEGQENEGIIRSLLFGDPAVVMADDSFDIWASVRRGEVWRLVTPIFMHYGIVHLLFNSFWIFDLGGQIENRKGSRYFLLLALALAVLANVGQAIEADVRQMPSGLGFAGFSGVTYGFFGYVLIKLRFGNREGYRLSQANIFLGILWFVLCLARSFTGPGGGLLSFIPPIANSAHTVGLFAGMAIAYAPQVLRREPT